MNSTYISNWNSLIDSEDDVYILGDLMLGDKSNISFLEKLNGRIHIALGNHDTNARQNMYLQLPNVVEMSWAIRLDYRKYHFLMTHWPCMTGNLEQESLKHGILNLFGHTHQKDNFFNDMPFMYHVGVDSHNGTPVLLDDIIEEMHEKARECLEYLQIEKVKSVRCSSCTEYPNTCGFNDLNGNCPNYKRDPPDGGFYG